MSQRIQIGKLGRETGLSIDTIRFYEKQGLLKEPRRSEGGFRLFSSEDLHSLTFIQRAQQLGFSLGEVRELLIVRDRRTQACPHVRDLLDHKLVAVRKKIEDLQKLERELQASLRKCNRELRKEAPSREECCPVLEEIGRTPKRQEK
jgi:MerR family transcriptional regulator, mercuric resistance operon regulatory protein